MTEELVVDARTAQLVLDRQLPRFARRKFVWEDIVKKLAPWRLTPIVGDTGPGLRLSPGEPHRAAADQRAIGVSVKILRSDGDTAKEYVETQWWGEQLYRGAAEGTVTLGHPR
jgi:hypothetical protein